MENTEKHQEVENIIQLLANNAYVEGNINAYSMLLEVIEEKLKDKSPEEIAQTAIPADAMIDYLQNCIREMKESITAINIE